MSDDAFIFQRGEPITCDLVISDAGAIDAASCSVAMKLKRAVGDAAPPKGTATVAPFAVGYVAPVGAEPGYWRGTIAATVSAGLAEANYVTDAEISSGGSVIIVTDPQLIRLRGSVTPS